MIHFELCITSGELRVFVPHFANQKNISKDKNGIQNFSIAISPMILKT